ncbi:DUF221 family protein [Crepidotus variabilis]|uniref:DUF221 family protein n=1 Tax=Crepidotus variabilis TaxID=179855 RepID=A0A9P6JQF1_9AGAR|nr:DUF221 family protein [Crepidotus variabilis]
MSAINPDTQTKNNTTPAFLTALWVNAALLAVEVGAFTLLKQKLWRIYAPRTVLPPPEKRAQELPKGFWRWIPAVLLSPTEDIIEKNGLDAYMFIRFIRLLIMIFSVFTFLTFASVIPADAVGIGSDQDLNRISWTNITDPRDQIRFTTHVVVVWILTAFVLYMINREMLIFVHLRHQFLISKSHSRLAQARTVLVLPVPEELANEHDLRTFASFVPGGIDRVWIYRDTKELNKLFERRVDACKKLESAESKILKTATMAWRLREKQHKKTQKRKLKDEEEVDAPLVMPPPSREFLDDLVPSIDRPKHKTGLLGLLGEKVDTIDWCKEEVARLNREIKDAREHVVKGKFLGSAFIRCNLQLGAHVLAQCLSYHEPLKMYSKTMEAHPKDIVWRNLDDGALEMTTRYITSWAATFGLILAWAVPATFVGSLSNLSLVCTQYKWLNWACRLPKYGQGFIQGVLPPLILTIFFALLPLVLRALAWYECIPRYSLISISVYKRFFLFLLIHGFLITTVSSGITATIEDIVKNPTDAVQKLASSLPQSSIFFLTYMVTQGLAGAGSALVQLGPLLLHYIRKWFLGRTPRQAYGVTFRMPSCDFGTTLPRFSLLASICFAYSVLAPFINLLALLSFIMFYLTYKFLFTQVFDQPDEMETGGLYFPMAIGNLFVGLYIEHICLICLLVLKANAADNHYRIEAIVQAVFIVVLLVLTAFAHIFILHSYAPLGTYLPMSLATKKMAQRYAKQKGKSGDEAENDDIELDLFSNRHRGRNVRRRLKTTAKKIEGKMGQTEGKIILPNGAVLSRRGSERSNHSKASTSSKDSKKSNKSKASKKSGKSSLKRPVIDDAAPALRDEDSEEEDDEPNDHAFDHPSAYVDQAWVWIPKDDLGLSEILVQELRKLGVDASDVGASMDHKGIVEVTRNPPDEDWNGGHDM